MVKLDLSLILALKLMSFSVKLNNKSLSTIEQKFADITTIFAADGYTFLKIRENLNQFDIAAKSGDTHAAQIVEVFTCFHRLCSVLSK